MAVVGDTIFLDYQLHDFSTDKFVRAVVKADGVEIGISPVAMPHVGDGAYFFSNPSTLTFPENTSEIAITYTVFKDALFTERLKKYGAGRDNYKLITVSISGSEIKKITDSLVVVDVEMDIVEEETVEMVFDSSDAPDIFEMIVEEEASVIMLVEQELEVSGILAEEENDIIGTGE